MKLHEYHRRKLSTTVRLLDESLDQLELLLSGPLRSSAGRRVSDNLAAGAKASLLEVLRQLRSDLAGLNREFELGHDELELTQLLQATVSSASVWLENCRPARMKGYGVAFDPAQRAVLEQRIDRMLARVEELRRLLR